MRPHEPTEARRSGVSAVTGAVQIAADPSARADALAVREAVFVDEQGVPLDLERDDYDAEAVHFVGYADDGEAVGAARLRRVGERTGKVERVAVRADRRGEGWGRRLMRAVEATAADRGLAELTMHAQSDVVEFYRKIGYETEGGEFEEAGIRHRAMHKTLRE